MGLGPGYGVRFLATMVYIDGEMRLPAVYSSLVLVLCAGMLAFIGWRVTVERRADNRYWLALAVAFLFLAVDELLAFHERTIEPLRDRLSISEGPLFFAWVIPGAVGVLAFLAVFLAFMRRLPPDTLRGFLVSGGILLAGALGMEMIGAAYVSNGGEVDQAFLSLSYVAIATMEEALEMIGVALFLTATVRHVEQHLGGGSLHVVIDDANPIRP